MKLLRNNTLFIIFILLLSACVKESEHSADVNNISISTIEPINNFTEEISSFDLMPLKTLQGPRISKVNKILKSNIGYFLLINDGKEVLHYSEDGDLLKSLNKQGKGPEEYTSIEDFAYSENRKTLFILNNNVIKEYDEKFDYVETYRPEIGWLQKCAILDDGKFLLFANGSDPKKNLFIYDIEDKLITNSYSINPAESFIPSISGAYGLDDPLIIKSPTSSTFYSFSEKNILSPTFRVNIDKGLVEDWDDPESFIYEDVCHLENDILMGFIDIRKGSYFMVHINKRDNKGNLYQISQIPPSADVDNSVKASLLCPPYEGASKNILYKFISLDYVQSLKKRLEQLKKDNDKHQELSAPMKRNLEILLSAEKELLDGGENSLDGFIATIYFQ